jgi:hypothetical protein
MPSNLGELCGQFEEVVLATLLSSAHVAPTSPFQPPTGSGADESAGLFTQALASAIEHAGGIGLRSELERSLERRS